MKITKLNLFLSLCKMFSSHVFYFFSPLSCTNLNKKGNLRRFPPVGIYVFLSELIEVLKICNFYERFVKKQCKHTKQKLCYQKSAIQNDISDVIYYFPILVELLRIKDSATDYQMFNHYFKENVVFCISQRQINMASESIFPTKFYKAN